MSPSARQPGDPSLFYTGLVAELYGPLRSAQPDPEPYARFIAASGEPALELGCGEGDPLLELRRRGLDVEGLDSSPDMLERCRRAAAEQQIDVVVHEQSMEAIELPRRYRSIYLAGPTFNLLPDDDAAGRALRSIRKHLDEGGSALIPLFVPTPTAPEDIGRAREATASDGSLLRVTAVAEERNEAARRQETLLRYERVTDGKVTTLDRTWVLHWHTQSGFRELVASAGLTTVAVLDARGAPATEEASVFVFLLHVAS